MHSFLKFLLSLIIFISLCSSIQAQVFLQLERFNNPKSKKFNIGDNLEFRLKSFPDTWQSKQILDLKHDEQIIVFEDQYYSIEEIKDMRLRYPAVKGIGKRLVQFSAVYFVYGGIASLVDDEFSIGKSEAIFGGSFALAGIILNQFFSKKIIRLSNRKRLRVMDLRFKIDGY
jgi:hypothetical protein